ncbi:uncharacterized protein LOC125953804 [Anopheles darlingi]|uniref:uncharacterized protein LOC125953804 n=1 Tax=Anopheles darlingi TaxID=43151 RepID=UPI0021003BD3|nr:uncharacterized protein LOC125953804 [Anopheles darlingi]
MASIQRYCMNKITQVIWRDEEMYLHVKFLTRVKFNRMLRIMVTCSHGMDILQYFIISKGNIVDVGIFRPNQMTKYPFQILVSQKLIPRSNIVLVAFVNGRPLTTGADVKVNDLGNNLEIKIEENIGEDGVDPGDEIELAIRGRPGSIVFLAAYDQGLKEYSYNHDIFLEDIWEMFYMYRPTRLIDFADIAATGLDAETFNVTNIEGPSEYAARGIYPDAPRFGMPGPYRTEFWESWMWQNLTIPSSGRFGVCNSPGLWAGNREQTDSVLDVQNLLHFGSLATFH